jgi:hypothetical protein
MKSNWLTNILLVAVLAMLISGQLPSYDRTAVQPAIAASSAANKLVAPQSLSVVSGSISIPASAFRPNTGGFTYLDNTWGYLYPAATDSWNYGAPVYLPQGAIVDQLVCYMKDSYPSMEGNCILSYNELETDDWQQMGYVQTSGSLGSLLAYSDNNIDYPVVDNDSRAYSMSLALYFTNIFERISFHGAKIHYHFNTVYLPTLCR